MSQYEYHQLLKYLYFEGYADSYEEAEYIVEGMLGYLIDEGYTYDAKSAGTILVNMSEEWIGDILDERWGGGSRGYREPIGRGDRNLSPRYRGLGGGTPEDEADQKRREKSAAGAAKRKLYANLAREAARRNS